MPRTSVTPQATVKTTETLKLSPQARRMLIERLDEHARLAEQVRAAKGTKKKPGRMYRIADEVDEIFIKERQGKALLAGCELDGHKLKHVLGKRSVFDKEGFMKKHGLTQADFDEFTTTVDNDPYIKITHGDDDEE